MVQLRDKSLSDKELIATAQVAKKVCKGFNVPFIINDRPDIALYVDADGVHIGQDDIPASLCRKILGTKKIVGLSTHAKEEFDASINEPIDYISAGPVVQTPTKPGRMGTGTDYIKYVAAKSKMPWFLTGNVNPETISDYLNSGARRFVVVRYLTQSKSPEQDATNLVNLLESYR